LGFFFGPKGFAVCFVSLWEEVSPVMLAPVLVLSFSFSLTRSPLDDHYFPKICPKDRLGRYFVFPLIWLFFSCLSFFWSLR